MITEKMIENFKQIFSQQIGNNYNNVIPLLEQWENNKKDIYQRLLNNQLTISVPISINISERQKDFAKKRFLYQYQQHQNILNQIDTSSLIHNRLQQDTIINGIEFKIAIKVTKILKRLIENQRSYRVLENGYSNFLQTFKTDGELCISIDPLDYLTMSDNSYLWNSCQSFEDGEYKGGPLSLMVDDNTIVCYVKGSKNFNLNGVEVSNKKWRILIHFNKEIPYLIINLEYPFNNKYIMMSLIKQLQEMLNKAFPMVDFIYYKFPFRKTSDYFLVKNEEDEGICFNDLLSINENGDYVNEFIKTIIPTMIKHPGQLIPIEIGSYPICPTCGNNYIITQGSIQCEICDPFEYCCNCGGKFHWEELQNINEELYCDSCFDGEFTYCDQCGERISRYQSILANHICENSIKEEENYVAQ